jgi:hypothetical protein
VYHQRRNGSYNCFSYLLWLVNGFKAEYLSRSHFYTSGLSSTGMLSASSNNSVPTDFHPSMVVGPVLDFWKHDRNRENFFIWIFLECMHHRWFNGHRNKANFGCNLRAFFLLQSFYLSTRLGCSGPKCPIQHRPNFFEAHDYLLTPSSLVGVKIGERYLADHSGTKRRVCGFEVHSTSH